MAMRKALLCLCQSQVGGGSAPHPHSPPTSHVAKVQKKYFACGICTEKIFFLRVAFVQKKSVFSEGCHGPMDLEKALAHMKKKKKKRAKHGVRKRFEEFFEKFSKKKALEFLGKSAFFS